MAAKVKGFGYKFPLFLILVFLASGVAGYEYMYKKSTRPRVEFLSEGQSILLNDSEPTPEAANGRSIWEIENWREEEKGDIETLQENRKAEQTDGPLSDNNREHYTPTIQKDSDLNGNPPAGQGISVPVLCYHLNERSDVDLGGYNVPAAKFAEQMDYLYRQGYRTIRLAEFLKIIGGHPPADLPRRPILLTFDDGALTNYTVVLPVLKKYNFTALLFPYVTMLSAKKKRYMRWSHLRELASGGRFEIGSHTYWHPRLPGLTRKEIHVQLQKSKERLERKLGVRVLALSYPFGLYDRRVIEEAKRVGYRAAFTIYPGENQSGDDPFTLNRYMVVHRHTLKNFGRLLALKSPRGIRLDPGDGSRIHSGQEIILRLPGIRENSLRAYLNGKKVAVTAEAGVYHGRLQFPEKRRYLNFTIRARRKSGERVFRSFLFLNDRST